MEPRRDEAPAPVRINLETHYANRVTELRIEIERLKEENRRLREAWPQVWQTDYNDKWVAFADGPHGRLSPECSTRDAAIDAAVGLDR